MDPINGVEYLPTYEDKDGDWMLVGDVPWKYVLQHFSPIKRLPGALLSFRYARDSGKGWAINVYCTQFYLVFL